MGVSPLSLYSHSPLQTHDGWSDVNLSLEVHSPKIKLKFGSQSTEVSWWRRLNKDQQSMLKVWKTMYKTLSNRVQESALYR